MAIMRNFEAMLRQMLNHSMQYSVILCIVTLCKLFDLLLLNSILIL
jgi:hypothetical protein